MKGLKDAAKAIRKAGTIVVASHINPDGDSIGSMLALGLGLEDAGKKVYFLSRDGVPNRYKELPGAKRVQRHIKGKKIDLAISVDCSSSKILGSAINIFRKAKHILEIDHHEFRKPFGGLELINTKESSVGEIVYKLLRELKIDVTREVAENILTSIVVETNSFRLPSTTAQSFSYTAKLVKKIENFHKLVENVYWSKRKEGIILSGICLSRCKFIDNGKIVWSIIRRKDFDRVGGKDEDVDPVPDEMRSVRGARIAILFREFKKGRLRLSLRSREGINVASLAESLGGGGHSDVAGCEIPNTPQMIKKVLQEAKKLL